MSGTGSTSYPYTKGSILPDTPTTATQTHPLSGSNVIGGKKSRGGRLVKSKSSHRLSKKMKGGEEESIPEISGINTKENVTVGGKKSKKNKRKVKRCQTMKSSWWF